MEIRMVAKEVIINPSSIFRIASKATLHRAFVSVFFGLFNFLFFWIFSGYLFRMDFVLELGYVQRPASCAVSRACFAERFTVAGTTLHPLSRISGVEARIRRFGTFALMEEVMRTELRLGEIRYPFWSTLFVEVFVNWETKWYVILTLELQA